jgi:2-polyprenyl-3-methyl-5-hydroxy-6-metoxy-1,4-benzoquinol methylase
VTRSAGDPDPSEESAEVREVWNANAEFWDARMGEGNEFHLRLLLPTLDRLLSVGPGDRVLEIACGNGQLARWIAGRGAEVVATDLSDRLLDLARRRTLKARARIDYRVVDATHGPALRALGSASFDAVVCNMALMDMPDVAPLAHAVPALLKPEGRFVFSTTHPCFNQGDAQRVARWWDDRGVPRETTGVEVVRYLTPRKVWGAAMIGQPRAQPYFERPLSRLVAPFLDAGLVVDALEEPGFVEEPETARSPRFSWSSSFREIPPALVVRMIRRGLSRRPPSGQGRPRAR